MARKAARIAAVQMVYEHMLGGDGGADTLGGLIAFEPENDDQAFIDRLIGGVADHAAEIDAEIEKRLKDWSMARIAKVDLAVLRVAVYELLFDGGQTPVSVVVNEAVRITQKYSTERSGSFVNGVLRAVADDHPA